MFGGQAKRDAAEIRAAILAAAADLRALTHEMRRNHPEFLNRNQFMQSRASSIRILESAAKLLESTAEAVYGRSNPQGDYRGRD
jgi:hypothetical protein